MQLQLDRLEGAQICANLMSRYVYYHASFRHKDYVKFWAQREDDILEMPWGKYVGYESVKKCYLDHHFDRGDEGAEEKMQGAVFFHHLDTPVIEVAADGKTARGSLVVSRTRDLPPPRRRGRTGGDLGLEQVRRGLHQGGRRLENLADAHLPHVQDSGGSLLDPASLFSGPMDLSEFPETGPAPAPILRGTWDRHMTYPADQPEPPVPYESYSKLERTYFGDMI